MDPSDSPEPENTGGLAARVSALVAGLGEICRSAPLEEKWLVAPSRRVGQQWLDALTAAGQPILNARVTTLRFLAAKIAGVELERRGLRRLPGRGMMVLVARLWEELRHEGGAEPGYLTPLPPGSGLIDALARTLGELRLSGLRSEALRPEDCEARRKGEELRELLGRYEQALEARGLVDDAELLRLAARRLRAEPGALAADSLVIAPDDLAEHALERALLDALPAGALRRLARDRSAVIRADWDRRNPAMMARLAADRARPGEGGERRRGSGSPESGSLRNDNIGCEARTRAKSDLALLAWLAAPHQAPAPAGDGSVRIFHAIGEVNEVREVVRRCLVEGQPLDRVEIVHTDAATYLPLIYEVLARGPGRGSEEPPVTFAEGLPARCFRPGRALAGWLAWVQGGFAQAVLARMVEDGLLQLPERRRAKAIAGGIKVGGERRPSFARLGALLRATAIGAGRERYLPALEQAIEAQGRRADRTLERDWPESSSRERQQARRTRRGLKLLRWLVQRLLRLAPAPGAPPVEVLAAAARFLAAHARCASALEEYASRRLRREIEGLAAQLAEEERAAAGAPPASGVDVWSWLSRLPAEVRVGGLGPRPGCLHVSSLAAGGHSGRKHVFVVGLDDARFPGAGMQDPLLLDGERRALSHELPTAAGHLVRRRAALEELLARQRGRVTLSYSCRSLADDRELFPAGTLLAVYRLLSGEHEADRPALLERLGPPVSFAPTPTDSWLDLTDWWLWRLAAGRTESTERPMEEAIGRCYPALGHGLIARRARASDRFTIYDGYVPEAGAELDPTAPDGPVLSASKLEQLGSCPLAFFFAEVLGVTAPPEHTREAGVWLGPLGKGAILHDLFCELMRDLAGQALAPSYERDRRRLLELLEAKLEQARREQPPHDEEAWRRETEEMRRAACIFLREEELAAQEPGAGQPWAFEVSIGLAPAGAGSSLDSLEPLVLRLPGGAAVRVRGRIDRVDRLPGSEPAAFSLWDYKTGRSSRYDEGKPFRGGRQVQGALYLALVESRLRQALSPAARVSRFGYFFPGVREHGRRLAWGAGSLAAGPEVLRRLCLMLQRGCFPCSDDEADVEWSDYVTAIGPLKRAIAEINVKLAKTENIMLAPFKELREQP